MGQASVKRLDWPIAGRDIFRDGVPVIFGRFFDSALQVGRKKAAESSMNQDTSEFDCFLLGTALISGRQRMGWLAHL
jgi:hypothetical protein